MSFDTPLTVDFSKLPALPVRSILGDLVSAMENSPAVLLRAQPGAGKTSLVPLALASSKRSRTGRILVLEPRRLAAVATATHMASLLGQTPGETVGYSVRGERRCGPATRIEILTEGLFTKRLLNDPALEGVSTLIFDEFHERSIHSDLALALSLELMSIRDDLSILIMSATMDSEPIQAFLASTLFPQRKGENPSDLVPLIECSGRQFPLEIRSRPLWPDGLPLIPFSRETRVKFCRSVADASLELLYEGEGTVLVFLPGKGEIEDLRVELCGRLKGSVEVLALHGSLSLAEQKKVLSDEDTPLRPRIVLATNIAETSLTVPGVMAVVDTGLVKVNRWHAGSGLDRLVIEREDAFSSQQRAGRAGRLSQGRVIRLWDEGVFVPRARESQMLRSELSSLSLDCASLGIRDPRTLPWIDTPPQHALDEAYRLLCALGALNKAGLASDRGRAMARLGLDVRPAAMVCMAAEVDDAGTFSFNQNYGPGPAKKSGPPIEAKAARLASLALAAALIVEGRNPQSPQSRETEALEDRFTSWSPGQRGPWPERVAKTARDILSRLDDKHLGTSAQKALESGRLVLQSPLIAPAFPDSLAKREDRGLYRLVSGREVLVEGPLSRSPWLSILDADAGERQARARLALAVDSEDALEILEALAVTEESWDWKGLEAFLVLRRFARRLELSSQRSRPGSERLPEALADLLSVKGLEALPWEDEKGKARGLLERLRFFVQRDGNEVIARSLSQDCLKKTLQGILAPWLKPRGAIIDACGLAGALESILDYQDQRRFRELVPEFFTSPALSKHHISYTDFQPSVRIKIQECFSLASSPNIMGVPLRFELLSPAQRPVQITSDLSSFWKTSWQEVRKELRGRYPKHYWPEDPSSAVPTTRLRPRD